MRSVARCAPRAGFRCDRHGVPRLPARRSGPAGGPAPARPSLGHGGPSLRPCSRCARSKRSLRVAFRPCSAHAAGGPRAAAFDRLLMAAIISPRRAPPALAEGFQTLPRGRLRKPSAHHPDGLARYALRRTNRRSSGLPAAMILPCARAQGRANRSLRLAPINRSRRQAASFACNAAAFTRIVDSAMNVGFAYGPVRDSGMDASPRQRRSVHSGRRY